MRIAIVLNGRFPTDRAYGVTTGATYKELEKLGHKVIIYAFPNQAKIEVDFNFKIETFSENLKSRIFRNLFSKNKGIASKILWKFYLMEYLDWVKQSIAMEKIDLLWIRDYNSIKITEDLRIKTLFEIHQKLDHQKILRINRIKDLLVVAPISKALISNTEEFKGRKVFAPMGIDENFLASKTDVANYCKNIKERNIYTITYAGKLFPGNVSKGVETIIELSKIFKNQGINLRFKIVGGNKVELNKFSNLLKRNKVESYFKLIGHVDHKEVPQYLKQSDFLILTKPSSPKYSGFPLKALEACSVGKLIMVEDCQIYRDIFEDKIFVLWFQQDKLKKILEDLEYYINRSDLDGFLLNNIEFSREFTWSKRTSRILSEIHS